MNHFVYNNSPLPPIEDKGGPAQPLLRVSGLRKFYRVKEGWLGGKQTVRAVDGLSFEVRKGETLGIVGESGCGKTTTARLITGMIAADEGEIDLDGEVFCAPGSTLGAESRRAVQMVFQDSHSSLNPRMSVLDTIMFGLLAHGVDNATAADYACRLMDAVGMPAGQYADRYPIELSGGQRQRINIARALALRPRLLLLDEPVSALDKSVEAQVLNLLVELRETLGLTYIFISHDLNVVRYIADRVVVMYLGQIIESAPAEAIFSRAAHPYTRALLASKPSPDPRVKIAAPPLPGDPPDPINPPKHCRFHTRCAFAQPVCAAKTPPLARGASTAHDHLVSCWMQVPDSGHSLAPAATEPTS
ncbi:oligopeptide/dipeptide ABC transporter ATP-binding protein [Acerihabitans sp.]|uniref:oligopeptide/dipeptide ABC transporter ATP-binding protein n=1 Tax=Acerihabitans sp. TaxID=2811394 RepID=UPI002ED96B4B